MIQKQTLKKIVWMGALGLALSFCASCKSEEEAQAMKTEPMPVEKQISMIESNSNMSADQKATAIAKIKAQSGPRIAPGKPN